MKKEKALQELDEILCDWPAETIEQKLDFMFGNFLYQADGVPGSELAEMHGTNK